jgi:hypothetical protein
MGLCVPKTSSVLISRRNRLTSGHHDRAAMFRNGRLGRAIQVEEVDRLLPAIQVRSPGLHLIMLGSLPNRNLAGIDNLDGRGLI